MPASRLPARGRSSGHSQGKLVLIMGPSGVGKSVILKQLRERHPDIHFPRSATTRPRREGEGGDLYHFVDDAAFDDLMRDEKLIEWAVVHGGARYGTMKDEILPFIDRGQIVLREVDVQGFESIRTSPLFALPGAPYRLQSIFILPQDKEQLIAHITHRAPIAAEELSRRIASMEKELATAPLCDVRIRNIEGHLDQTLARVEQAILSDVH